MATYALETRLKRVVRSFLTSSPSPMIPEGLELIEGRLYMPVLVGDLSGYLMVALNTVATVYDQSGNGRRNFEAREQDIQAMLKLLGK